MAHPTTNGALFKEFYADPAIWGRTKAGAAGDWYVDDLFILVDGVDLGDMDAVYDAFGDDFERLPDAAKVVIESGYLEWQGNGHAPAARERDFPAAFVAWEKARATSTWSFTLDVSKDASPERQATLAAILEALGATGHDLKAVAAVAGLDEEKKAAVNRAVDALLDEGAPVARPRAPGR